jgi:hypothetical protein
MKINPIISCQKAAFLIEQDLDRCLNLKEKILLVVHIKMCNICSKYKEHAIEMNDLLNKQTNLKNPSLSPSFKSDLMKKLKQKN